jgi:nitroimidazol reductase NimA-like FMN-containing flavoprotein (pyridoxamine 5'-phosphate oxidase superfamily)
MAGEANAVANVPRHVLDYLKSHETLTLATASPAGVPRAATFVYVNDGTTFYVWTRPGGTTAKHIAQNPQVSFAVDDYVADWRLTKGVQVNGKCRVVLSPAETRRIVELFSEKFPHVAAENVPSNVVFFRIEAIAVVFIDNTGGGAGDQSIGQEYSREVVYDVFRSLPHERADQIAGEMRPMTVEAGQDIVREGTAADKFFIVVDGEVEVLRDLDGEERRLATMGKGQFFGEIAILRDTPRTATVRALTRVTLLAMERDTFRNLVAQSLGTTQDFDAVVRERLEREPVDGKA